MSASSFKSVFMVASCAGAALGCYLVSLRVATERAALEDVETKIVLAQRDLRLLQTEIGTRGRLAQLERWNAKVMALSAPTADQFLSGSFELAKLTTPEHKQAVTAPVVLASAPRPDPAPLVNSDEGNSGEQAPPATLLHQASLKRVEAPSRSMPSPAKPAQTLVPKEFKTEAKAEVKVAARPSVRATAKPKPAADPLAPLETRSSPARKPSKDPAKKQ